MRQIGLATKLYADDHGDQLPRSQHSAVPNRQQVWERALAPLLGGGSADTTAWTNLYGRFYRCPNAPIIPNPKHPDYGLNGWFEVAPNGNRISSIRRPASTVSFCEIGGTDGNVASNTDHVMPWEWELVSDAWVNDCLKPERHQRRANYVYVDGHAVRQKFTTTFGPAGTPNLWNPVPAP
jgi:prepilin-type processing-associated H-X9-DG protein